MSSKQPTDTAESVNNSPLLEEQVPLDELDEQFLTWLKSLDCCVLVLAGKAQSYCINP